MKRIIMTFFALMMSIVLSRAFTLTVYSAGYVAIDETNFPDKVFRDYVSEKFDTDGDGYLDTSEGAAVKKIDICNKGVSSLKGIEHFPEITELSCYSNNLTSLDVRYNTALVKLECFRNQITALDVSENTALVTLDCGNNPMKTLYVSNNSELEYLACYNSQLETLDVSNNVKLKNLFCSNSQLTKLELSNNTELVFLDCSSNQISSLDLYKNKQLEVLQCSNNSKLTFLGVDNHEKLEILVLCNDTRLATVYSRNCALTTLDVENCTALTTLDCADNSLAALDVSSNGDLIYLNCSTNQLKTLDVRKNEDLLDLYCSNNYLTVLDISKNSLYGLDCHNNNLSFLCITSSPHLSYLSCYKNNITLLDLSPSSNLCDVYINGDRYDDEYGDDVYTYWDPEALEQESLAIDKTTEVTTEPIPDTTITTQPKSVSAAIGTTAKFTVAATGGGLKYQWQVSTDGSTWKNSSATGYNTKTISLKVTAAKNGYRYRCVITNANGITTTSSAAKLTVNTITITEQPVSVSAKIGATAEFTVMATGTGLKYQWQVSTDGSTWKNSSATGYNTKSISMKVTASKNGYQYRCVITDANGAKVTSSAAKLLVKTSITSQPTSVSAGVGTTVEFSVTATGAGLKYQWQVSTDGSTWKNSSASGCNTNSISMSVTASKNGYRYRCVITNANKVKTTSSAAKLTVLPTITASPKSVSAAAGTTVKFTVTATGAGLKYQWQVSTDGSTWKNSSATGYNTKTISLKATASKNGYRYRCVITDANGSKMTSTAAKLTVK